MSAANSLSIHQFREKFSEFCSLQGERTKLVLPLRDRQVELPLLWRLVDSLGGSEAVGDLGLWPSIAEQLLSVSATNTVAAEAVKSMFHERLGGFERYLNTGIFPVPVGRTLRGGGHAATTSQPRQDGMQAATKRPRVEPPQTEEIELSEPKPSSAKAASSQPAQRAISNGRAAASTQSPGVKDSHLAWPQPVTVQAVQESGPQPSGVSLQRNGVESEPLRILQPPQNAPDVPEWAMKPNVFFPVPVSRRDPRQSVATQTPPEPVGPLQTSRDPRLRGAGAAGPSRLRPADLPAARETFKPTSAPQPSAAAAQPRSKSQFRPLTDPFQAFAPHPQLWAKVNAAMASHRRASRAVQSVDHQLPPGRPGDESLTLQTQRHDPRATGRQPAAPAGVRPPPGKLEWLSLTESETDSGDVDLGRPPGRLSHNAKAALASRGTKRPRSQSQASDDVLSRKPGMGGWPSAGDLAVTVHARAPKFEVKDRMPGAVASVHDGIAYVAPMRPAGIPSVLLSTNREWQQGGMSHSLKEFDARMLLRGLKLIAAGTPTEAQADTTSEGDGEPESKRPAPEAGQQPQQQPLPSVPAETDGVHRLSPPQRAFLMRFRRANWEEEPPLPAPSPLERSPEPGELRRSGRTRARPNQFVPTFEGDMKRGRSEESDDDKPSIRHGPQHQAELPQCSKKPPPGSTPPAEQAAWLRDRVFQRGAFADAGTRAPIVTMPVGPEGRRRYAVHGRINRLLSATEVTDLGLDHMGLADAVGWTPPEVRLFARGLDAHRRDFVAIASRCLPDKGPLRVGSFYYNVWKTRATPEAVAWYRKRDEDMEREEIERTVADQARAEMQAFHTTRRQLKETLAWLKTVARQPLGNYQTKTKAVRVGRATVVLAKSNVERLRALA